MSDPLPLGGRRDLDWRGMYALHHRLARLADRAVAVVRPAGLAILLLMVSGCSILGDDGGQISGEVVTDSDATSETAQSDSDDGQSGSQATFDGEGTATSNQAETTSSTTADDSIGSGPDPTPSGDFCQASGGNSSEIRFDPGASSATIDSEATTGQVDLYRLDVGRAQIMTITLTSPDPNAMAALQQPDGNGPADAVVDTTIGSTQAGTYWICVDSGETGAAYKLFVSVIDDNTPTKIDAPWCGDRVNDRGEIRFDAGQFSGTVEQAVVRGERDLYRLGASADQALDVFLTSLEDNAVFDLRAPDGELLITEVSDFRIPLPLSGTYEFCVGSTRGNASYSLEVAID